MTILASIEGPKGSGKSSLAQGLKSYFGGEIIKFDENLMMTPEAVKKYANSPNAYILERGAMSSMIYGWCRGAQYDAQIYGDKLITKWRPASLNDFKVLDEYSPCNFVVYANPETLKQRIIERNDKIGKGANDVEFSELKTTAMLFKAYGEVMVHIPLMSYVLIDSTEISQEDMLQRSIELIESARNRKRG